MSSAELVALRTGPVETADPEEVVTATWCAGIEPPPPMTVTEWADQHRVLTRRSSNEPGPYRSSRTPFSRAIMDALSPQDPCQFVSAMTGTQVSKTEMGNNWLGFTIDHDPCSFMVVLPTVDVGKRHSKTRVEPMIRSSAKLADRVAPAKSRDSANTVLEKEFPGGSVVITGANSGAGLRSTPVRRLHLDEIDAYPLEIPGEGPPIEIAIARTDTYGDTRKIYRCSTPTVRECSPIEEAYEDSDRSQYWVPCPDCGEMQVLEWAGFHFTPCSGCGEDPEEKPDAETRARTAHMHCIECRARIEETSKPWMFERGEWRARNPERTKIHRGFHLSSLYSPLGWLSWAALARQWLDAQGDREKLRTFTNLRLAETFEDVGAVPPPWEILYARRETYPQGQVPERAQVLTIGVDVQGGGAARVEAELVAWAPGLESWSLGYFTIPGEVGNAEVDNELARLITSTWPRVGDPSVRLPVRMTAIDAGYLTQAVYQFCERHRAAGVVPVMGQPQGGTLIGQPKRTDIMRKSGKKTRGAVRVFPVFGNVAKTELYSWLRLEPPKKGQPFPAGWCHFLQYPDSWFKQLTCEKQRRTYERGLPVYRWEKPPGAANEALDCRVYARAAASIVGCDRWTEAHWEQYAAKTSGAQKHKPKRRDDEPSPFDRFRR